MGREIFTIGHSNHAIESFVSLLKMNHVTAVADVRSIPASRFTPHFNREALGRSLYRNRVHYAFLGRELGARPKKPDCYVNGQVQYDRLAVTPEFKEGIERLQMGMQNQIIAIMCAEQEPLECHRTVLISRVLAESGASVTHIHGGGRVETHDNAMLRLLSSFGLDQADLFNSQKQLLNEALGRQEKRIAFVDKEWLSSREAGFQ